MTPYLNWITRVFAVWAGLLAASVFVAAEQSAATRPNIIFVLADDFRWDALGYRGHPIVQTPHLDALARGGVVFENAFTTTSICSVSRATFLSGQWMRRHGIKDFATGFSPEQWRQTYPALLRQAGYYTGFVGKIGVGDASMLALAAQYFDEWKGQAGQGPLDFIDENDSTRTHETAKLGNHAVEFVQQAPQDRPFVLSVSFSAVHARDRRPREFQPDERDEALYADSVIPLPPTATQEAFQKLPEFVQKSEGRTRWHWRFDEPEKAQRILRDYYRLITGLDREIGRLREAVAARGAADQTIFVFYGDNGFATGDRGLADKWFMYEESLRIPALIYDPRIPEAARGRRVTALVLNADLAPTLAELGGVTPPAAMQGRSLVPWLRGETPANWRTDFFYEHHTFPQIIPPSEGVRSESWKYIRWIDREPVVEELFHLRDDPLEQTNLAADPAAQTELERWRARWQELARAME